MVAVMEAVPVSVFIAHDAECLSMVGNRAAHKLLRTPPGTNLSVSFPDRTGPGGWREVCDGKDIPARELPMQIAARTGSPVHDYECDIEFDDGTSRSWLGHAVPLFDELRRPRGAVGAFVDITDRKRAEETLEAANKELRSFVHALTNGLQKRTMETLVKGLLRYWEITERAGESLSPVDCNRALSKARQELAEPIRQRGAVVTADPLPTVVADEVGLVEVFRNLIENSIRYCGDAVIPRIHISAVRSGERWLFSVRDNGIGINRADSEKVFGMFSSSHGIGLALCRKVVERHGGRIWVESEAGQGAAFRFTLPIYLDESA
jgi:light-regulated signal transduction histidine kinase (bacteriophytochrome)